MGFPTMTQLVRLRAVRIRNQMETQLHLWVWYLEACSSSGRDFPAQRHHLHSSCGGVTAACIYLSIAHYVDLIKLITAEHARREKGSQRSESDNLVRRRLHAEILLSTPTPTFLSQLFIRCSLTSLERQRACAQLLLLAQVLITLNKKDYHSKIIKYCRQCAEMGELLKESAKNYEPVPSLNQDIYIFGAQLL